MKFKFICAFLAACSFFSCATNNLPPVKTVAKVDLNRYLGLWYEIARFDQTFQKGCVATTAEYSLKDEGKIKVVNRCRIDSVNGKEKMAEGTAWVVDKESNAKLKVTFFWPFSGNYWIIDLDENYKYAVVGEPGRNYLWILSRTPKMDQSTYDSIISRLIEQKYDIAKLKKYPQKD